MSSEIAQSRFPETWIWDKYSIGESGALDIVTKVPDSMTTWVTSVFATNPNTVFGIADEKQTPNGVYRFSNKQVLVDVTSVQSPFTDTVVLGPPEDMIDGTKLTNITMTGDYMVPSVEGLSNLIRLPHGCGEQTMLNFAPAIYITKYLSTVGKLTKEIQEKALKSLKKGLQNELTYQRHDGSFSAFGNKDSHGCTCVFGQAAGHITIDKAVMLKAMHWLLRFQQPNGAFYEPGKVIHYQMQAGTASGTKIAAFILIALIENRNTPGVEDTIISLQALTEFSSRYGKNPGPEYSVKFDIRSPQNYTYTYSTTPATLYHIHSTEVPDTVDDLYIEANGEGSAVIDISTSYYVSRNEINDYIAVDVSILSETIHTITVYPCLTWTGPDQSGMLIMEVEMPTGFQPDNEYLKAESTIKRHETNGRNIALYLDGLNPKDVICARVKMDRADPVVKSQACHVTVYDYYEPSHQAMTRYESGVLKSSNICMICPLCEFCTGVARGGKIGTGRQTDN